MDQEQGGAPVQPLKDAGTAFGKYTLLCKLATGGMGELYVARQTGAGGFEKLVVIKRLLPHLAEDAHFVAMLLDEARIAARLSHPNVCQVYDLGEAEGHYYIAMEHLEGTPASLLLRRARRAGQRLDVGLAAALLKQAAEGLDHAHALKDAEGNSVELVHRDVSPSNLFVATSGIVKVLDFGVAKSQDALARTHTGALKGKYAYMSPEQVIGNPVDRRSDVFSLGVVLYELMTAQRLFWRDSEYKMFQAIVEDPVPSLLEARPGLPPKVGQVADRALSRDPDRRFKTAGEMAEAVEDAVAGTGGLWKASQVAEYVHTHFSGEIEQRRRDVQAGIAAANQHKKLRPTSSPVPGGVTGPITLETSGPIIDVIHDEDTEAPATTARVPAVQAAPRSRRGLWIGALALATAVGGGGVFAYRQMGGESAGASPPPVVVLGGEVETSDGRVARAARIDAGQAAVSAAADAGAAATPDKPVKPVKPKPEADPYSARLARSQSAIRRCFNENATTVSGAPEVAVALRIDAAGKVARAGLVPAALDDTELGSCVIGVARKVNFGPQDGEIQVTIPLKVRRRGK
ncbi:MAG TPA: protein kinase [Kofleriaceae bacterium]|nr:protein kinase [Kofleriaceae bacterium]